MAQELQYTSVPQGLKPGSRGFCAVVMTRGMSPHVSERLESLSGYDMFYKVGSPNIDRNPPQHAHWIVELDGKPSHVLSYVGYAGMDFNGRANKFAHHVRLEDSDLAPGGPAWMILNQGAMIRTFMPPARWVEPRSMPRGDAPARECEAWIRAWGDAGWAGVLAQQTLIDPAKPVYVIYPMLIDPLPLIAEAVALLPTEARWQATFSSYFTRVPADVTCSWRFCLEGTDAAKEARAAANRTLMIDLLANRQRAPDSAMAIAARKAAAKFNPLSLSSKYDALPAAPAQPKPTPPPTNPPADQGDSIPLPPSEPLTLSESGSVPVPAETAPVISGEVIPLPGTPPPELPAAPAETEPEPSAPTVPMVARPTFVAIQLPPSTPPHVRNDISLPSPPPPPLRPLPSLSDRKLDGSSGPPRPRHYEPTSMMDLAHEENDLAELEDAMRRQKRAKKAKTRAATAAKARSESQGPEEEENNDSDFPVENDSEDSKVGSLDDSALAEKGPSPFDTLAGTSPKTEKKTKSAPAPQAPQPDAAPQPEKSAPEPIEVPKSNPAWIVIGAVAVIAVLAWIIVPWIKDSKSPLRLPTSTTGTTAGNNSGSSAQAIDPTLPRAELKAVNIANHPQLLTSPLVLIPDPAKPVPAASLICAVPGATSIRWIVAPAPADGKTPAYILDAKPSRVTVIIPCATSISPGGQLNIGELSLEKGELVWRWLFIEPWPESIRNDWIPVAHQLAQSLVEIEPASDSAAKLQFFTPNERTLHPETGSTVISDIKAPTPLNLEVLPLPMGWKPVEGASEDKALELVHTSGARVTFTAILSRSIWTIIAVWPADSQIDRIVSQYAKHEQEVAQLLTLKTTPAAIAEVQNDIDHIKDEVDGMTTQINQLKSQKGEPAAVQTLESRRSELSASLAQLRTKIEKMRTAPAAIESLRALRKNEAERLEALRSLNQSRLFVKSKSTGAVLAIVNLVNPTPPSDNTTQPVP